MTFDPHDRAYDRAGQRSYVKLLRGRREEPGNEASSEMDATNSPSVSLDSPVSDIHIAKIAKDFIRNWEELAPYLRLLPAQEYEIKKDGRYGDQKREALRLWKE